MHTLRPNRDGRATAVIGLAGTLTLALACPAWAQHQGFDPYKPYGGAYRPYAYPVYRPSVDMYGRHTAPGGSGMNYLNQYFEKYGFTASPALRPSGDDDGEIFAIPSRGNRPYYEAYRRYDQAYGRIGGLSEAEREFYSNRQKREQAYRDALREADPKVRARKMQAVERMSLEAARDVPAASRRSITQKKSRPAAPAASSARPTANRPVETTPALPPASAVTGATTGSRSNLVPKPASPAPGDSSRFRSGQNLSRPRGPEPAPDRVPPTTRPRTPARDTAAPPGP